MNKYLNTIIYKIICKNESVDYLYVGSSVNFKKRIDKHKSDYNNIRSKSHNLKTYVQIREHGGWDNFQIVEIEKFPCNNNREAEAREEHFRILLNGNVNSKRCYVSTEQKKNEKKEYDKFYSENNREKKRESCKKYKELNQEKINQKFNCQLCGGKFTYKNKSEHEKSKKHQTSSTLIFN